MIQEYPTEKHTLPTSEPTNIPTEEERYTLRRVPGSLPIVAYVICAVEFAERASYYGVQPLISNFVNRKMPVGGNGWGAPRKGTQQTAGALGRKQFFQNLLSPTLFGFWSSCFEPHSKENL